VDYGIPQRRRHTGSVSVISCPKTISGHKTRAVFDRYNIVSESDLIDAARKIEEGRETEVGHSFGHSDEQDDAMDRAEPLV
jgi:hypothetical protein